MSEPATPADPAAAAPPPETRPPKARTRPGTAIIEPSILRRAVREAFVKLDPRTMIHIPIMFVVEIGTVVTAVQFFAHPSLFVGLITLWLLATVLFWPAIPATRTAAPKFEAGHPGRPRLTVVV